jgi:hypothetical protein
MRRFSNFEKQTIELMTKKVKGNLNILDLIVDASCSDNRAIKIETSSRSLILFHKSEDEVFINELIESIYLIKYLQKESLIFIHSNFDIEPVDGVLKKENSIINPTNLNEYVATNFSTTIFDDVTNFRQSYFTSSTELLEIHKNKFISTEQTRHEQSIKVSEDNLDIAKKSVTKATVAIYLSIALGILSIGASFYLADQQSSSETKLDTEQFENLMKINDVLRIEVQSIDSILKIENNIDTTNIKKVGNTVYSK